MGEATGLPLVAVVATGGSIANTAAGRVPMEQVIADLPEAQELARYAIAEVVRVGSEELTTQEWLGISRAVEQMLHNHPAAVGVVVTHGTFTAEETAYFLHLTVQTDKPILVACAQRRHGRVGKDGDRNFLDAVRTVISPTARGKGVMVLLNEAIHSARDVVKTSARLDGFRSRDLGPLGYADDDRVTFYREPLRRHSAASEFHLDELVERPLPYVEIFCTYVGSSGRPIRAMVDSGSLDGIVMAGFAFSGTPNPQQRPELMRAVELGIPVVVASRGGEGRIPAAEKARDLAWIRADNLPPQKAAILLTLALTRTRDRQEIQRMFDEY